MKLTPVIFASLLAGCAGGGVIWPASDTGADREPVAEEAATEEPAEETATDDSPNVGATARGANAGAFQGSGRGAGQLDRPG